MRKSILLLSIALACSIVLRAQNFQFLPDKWSTIGLTKVIAASGSPSSYYDALPVVEFGDWTGYVANHSAYHFKDSEEIIRVGIVHDSVHVPAFKYRLSFTVLEYDYSSNTVPYNTSYITMDINYNPDSLKSYQDLAVYRWKRALRFQLILTNVQDVSGSPSFVPRANLAKNIYIESEINTQQYVTGFNQVVPECATVPGTSDNVLRVQWVCTTPYSGNYCVKSDVPSNEIMEVKPVSYELEWTYVDDYICGGFNTINNYPAMGYRFDTANSIRYDFRKNSTRIQTSKLSYDIPLLYEHGAIIYRIRALQPTQLSSYKDIAYSAWSLPDSGAVYINSASNGCFPGQGFYMTQSHAQHLNWQSTINFAEDGKFKQSVGYYDGILKNRQTQTKINTDSNYIVVAEQAYDHEGRSALHTLPIPVQQRELNYRGDILINSATGKLYNAGDFDKPGCSLPDSLPPVASYAQANIYYSPLNTDTSGMQRFVPDAEGYPIIQNVFSSDNTNKILWQGAAGKDFQLWKGHATHYDYAQSGQPEVDRLFGTEAGQSQFYPKQVVTDPNGQSSISIYNQSGQLVASGLIGLPDTIGKPLDLVGDYVSGDSSCEDLLKGVTQQKLNSCLSVSMPFYSDKDNNPYRIRYAATVPAFNVGCGKYLWAKGVYHADITTDCGVSVVSMTDTIGKDSTLSSNVSMYATSATATATVQKGKYIISKELCFSPDDIKQQVGAFIAANEPNCYHDDLYFIRKSIDSTKFPCRNSGATSICEQRRDQMIKELFPKAKYGNYFKKPDSSFNLGDTNSILTTVPVSGNGHMAYGTGRDASGNPLIPSLNQTDAHWTSSYDSSTWADLYPGYHPRHATATGQFNDPNTLWLFPPAHPTTGNTYFKTTILINSLNISTIMCHFGGDVFAPPPATHPYGVSYYVNGQAQSAPANWDNFHPAGLVLGPNELMFKIPKRQFTNGYNIFDTVALAVTFTGADTGYMYRYQASCLTLPNSITKNGISYKNLAALPVQTFIDLFNDTVASALLPLHPEYCKLGLCDDGTFEKQMKSLASFQQAIAANRFVLDSIIVHDPLYLNSSTSLKPGIKDRLSRFRNFRRIDSIAIEQAYCNAGNGEEASHCATYLYPAQIAAFTFINANVQQQYFSLLKKYYEANRTMLWQQMMDSTSGACPSCANLRMHQVGHPVFPTFFNGNGHVDTSIHMPLWMDTIYTKALAGDTTGLGSGPLAIGDSLSVGNATICNAQIENILKDLAPCTTNNSISSGPLFDVFVYLTGYCNGNSGSGLGDNKSGITPTVLNAALAYANLNKSDLCNAFLTAYGLLESDVSVARNYSCGDSALYSGLTQFLNRTEVTTAIANATAFTGSTASSSVTLNSSNPFESKLITQLNSSSFTVQGFLQTIPTATTGAAQYVKLLLQGANSVTLYIRSKVRLNPIQLNGQSSITFNNAWCINNDPQALSDGYLAQYSAFVSATAGSNTSDYLVWSKEIPLMIPSDASSLAGSLTCMDIKQGIESFIQDTAIYKYDPSVNHPLFKATLTNYLNYRFHKKFSYEDYSGLMNGCALSDRLVLNRYLTSYEIVFSSSSDASSFEAALASVGTSYPDYFSFIDGSSGVHYWINLSGIYRSELLTYKNFLDGYSGGVTSRNYLYSGSGDVILKQDGVCSNALSISSTVGTLSSSGTIQMVLSPGYTTTFTQYTFTPAGSTPQGNSDNMAAVISALASQCPSAQYIPTRQLLRSSDYGSTAKSQYLNYIFGLSNTGHDAVLPAIAPNVLQQQLSALSGKKVTYDDPACQITKRNLYVWTSNQSSYAGSAKAISILQAATATPNDLFPTANAITVSSSLRVYHKANGDYWYRYFDANNHLYNLFITPPQNSIPALSSYVLDSFRVAQGKDSTRNFIAWVHSTYPTTGPSIPCSGYADFTVGYSQCLSNVILLDKPGGEYCGDSLDCEHDMLSIATASGKAAYYQYFDSLQRTISNNMVHFLVSNTVDSLNFCSNDQKYHFTLNYYDVAGNLARTVPPAGIRPLVNPYTYQSVPAFRDNSSVSTNSQPLTAHKKVSTYKYNAQNKLVFQQSPDGGSTYFFYDAGGRIVFSQNSKQRATGDYSYFLYDRQGRPIESGQVKFGCTQTNAGGVDFDTTHCNFIDPFGATYNSIHPDYVQNSWNSDLYSMDDFIQYVRTKSRVDVVVTTYDTTAINLGSVSGYNLSTQENLQHRVSQIAYYPIANPNYNPGSSAGNAQFTTYYSYDLEGNAKTVTYDYQPLNSTAQRYKRVDYDYDLISGKINALSYNRSRPDQFYHRYEYDADNRMVTAYTSNDGLIWNKDARYGYYKHGPLAQVQIGDAQIQSLEYAYTINGWLKAINSDVLNPSLDMGQNGLPGDMTYARDAMIHALGYYDSDYKPIAQTPVTHLPEPAQGLWNGNIAQQTTGMQNLGTMQRSYRYDQLQRIKLGTNAIVDNSNVTVGSPSNIYRSSYKYDPDGNLQALTRWNGASTPAKIDSFSYDYTTSTTKPDNRLLSVRDAITTTTGSDLPSGQLQGNNYKYDASGNLTYDRQAHLKMDWTTFGKLHSVTDTLTSQRISFDYDGRGNRIYKEVVKKNSANLETHLGEYYVRDASGNNILTVYKLRSTYSPVDIFKSLHANLISDLGFRGFIKDVVAPMNGFQLLLEQEAIADASTWVSGITDNTLTWYMQRDDGETQNRILLEGDGWMNDMRDFDASIYVNALSAYTGDEGGADLIAAPLAYSSEAALMLQHFCEQMPDEAIKQIWDKYNVRHTPGDAAGNANNLNLWMQDNGAQQDVAQSLQDGMHQVLGSSPQSVTNFWNTVVGDDNIFKSNNLRVSGGNWTYGIATAVDNYADEKRIYDFFDQWGQSASWLSTNTSLDYRLNIVYNNDAQNVIDGFMDNVGSDALSNVVAAIPGLTVPEYLDKIVGYVPDLAPYVPRYVNTEITDTVNLAEHHIYGIGRLGVQTYDSTAFRNIYDYNNGNPGLTVNGLGSGLPWYSYGYAELIDAGFKDPWGHPDNGGRTKSRTVGKRYYDLTDHLGNVLVSVLDRKTGHRYTSTSNYDYWKADVIIATDMYPFGMEMPGRTYTANIGIVGKYGFNGQQRDDETYGKGNALAFGARIFSSRIGTFFSIDRKFAAYPWQSPYCFAANNPISLIDRNGDGPELNLSTLLANPNYQAITTQGLRNIIKGAYPTLPDWQVNISAGHMLENAYAQFSGFPKNRETMLSSVSWGPLQGVWPRKVKPDFIEATEFHNKENGDVLVFPYGGYYEVTATQFPLTLDSKNQQLDAYLNKLPYAQTWDSRFEAGEFRAAQLTLVVPYGTIIGNDVLQRASGQGVNLYVSYAFRDRKNGGAVFSNPVQLNKLTNEMPHGYIGSGDRPAQLDAGQACDIWRGSWRENVNDRGATNEGE